MADNDDIKAALAKLEKTNTEQLARLSNAVAKAQEAYELARADVTRLQRDVEALQRAQGELGDIAANRENDPRPPLFRAIVRAIHNGSVVWDAEQYGVAHEVVDGIGSARAVHHVQYAESDDEDDGETIVSIPVGLTRIVDKKTRRAGYIATRPDGQRIVFQVATANGRLLRPSEFGDDRLALSEQETLHGAAARDARDAQRKADEEAEFKARWAAR